MLPFFLYNNANMFQRIPNFLFRLVFKKHISLTKMSKIMFNKGIEIFSHMHSLQQRREGF